MQDWKGFDIVFSGVKFKNLFMTLVGSAILAFGLYNVHSFSGVTEGGVLGATLLLKHLFDISPAVSGFVLNAACYCLGFKILGRNFLMYSIIAGGGFSAFYYVFERFDPLWPSLAETPLLAAILGAVFVGVGAGLCVRSGGAPSGDDALAMGLSAALRADIRWIYLASDLIVLRLSLSYIPLTRIIYSLLTVVLSGQIIGLIQGFRLPKRRNDRANRRDAAKEP